MYTPIVQQLVDYLDGDALFRAAFDASFALALATGVPEFHELNIHTVEDYIGFMDKFVNWVPTENIPGNKVYTWICMFYFIIDLPPVREFQDPILPAARPPWLWMSNWLIEYAQTMGQWMDTPQSISPASVQTFYDSPAYHMQDYIVPEGGWTTFNHFFARHIKKNLRPICDPTNDRVIVSPADCTFDGWWPIDDADAVTFTAKGVPWSISQLLADTKYGAQFSGGVFTHSFLSPTDYHRQHAPVAGKVLEAKVVPGLCYLKVVVKEDPEHPGGMRLGMHRHMHSKYDTELELLHRATAPPDSESPDLDAPDSPGYQFLQARGVIIIDNPVLGLVAVLPVGMAQVSSVLLSVAPCDTVEKGDEISRFHFGGSDIVMVFQEKAKVQFLHTPRFHYKFGERAAISYAS